MCLRSGILVLSGLISAPAMAVPVTLASVATYGPAGTSPVNDAADAGDLNFDGLRDLALGDPSAGGTGMVHLRFGGPPPGFILPPIQIMGVTAGDAFGHAVDGVGDYNCDGFMDLLVGAPTDTTFTPGNGAVYLFTGPFPLGILPAFGAGLILAGEFPGDNAGKAVQFIDDVDLDGCSELLIGAPFNAMGGPGAGAAYIVPSSLAFAGLVPLNAPGISKFIGMAPGDNAGFSVDNAGDFSADGIPDIIVGAPRGAGGNGQVHIINLMPSVVGAVMPIGPVSTTLTGLAPGSLFGWSVDGDSDLNLDGHSEVMIGAPGSASPSIAVRRGTAHLAGNTITPFAPGGIFPAATTTAWYRGVVNNGQLGWDVSFDGDFNGDGLPDFAASAPTAPSGGGMGIVYVRRGTGIVPPPGLVGNITMAPAPVLVTAVVGFGAIGYALDGSADNDGDGLSDLLVGAWRGSSAAGTGRNLVGSY